MTCTVDAEDRVLISTQETAAKTKNLRRRPRASLCVFTDNFFGEWMQIEATRKSGPLPPILCADLVHRMLLLSVQPPLAPCPVERIKKNVRGPFRGRSRDT